LMLGFWGWPYRGNHAGLPLRRDFVAAMVSLAVFAPLGCYLARFSYNWLLDANLLYLLVYSAVFSVLFFVFSIGLQVLLGSQSSSYIIFLIKKKMIKR